MRSSKKPSPFLSPSLSRSPNCFLVSCSFNLISSLAAIVTSDLRLSALHQTTPHTISLLLFSCLPASRFASCGPAVTITVLENPDYSACKSRHISSYCFVTTAAKVQIHPHQISVNLLQRAVLILANPGSGTSSLLPSLLCCPE